VNQNQSRNTMLWYKEPAKTWEEALPMGNGNLGAMVYGSVLEDRILLNEESIWYGGPKRGENPNAAEYLPEIRRLLFAGEAEQATRLARMALFSNPKYFNPYQPLGDFHLFFEHREENVSCYRRELHLENGIHTIRYRIGEVEYLREMFISYPDQVMVIRLSSSKPRQLNFSATLNRRPFEGASRALADDSILMTGECGRHGVEFACLARALNVNGTVRTIGDFIDVKDASSVLLLLTAKSTFRDSEPEDACRRQLEQVSSLSYDELKSRHIADYTSLFDRVYLRLTAEDKTSDSSLPTDMRLKNFRESGDDNGCFELMFHYGRYLMIASSRAGGLPANLQGIWSNSYTPPWESKYTININTQMNYWPAEVCGLSECHEPLLDHVDRMRPNGRVTARELYGCSGFVAHHNTNLWGETRPEGILSACVIWPMGAAWLSLHFWERYLYSLDESFLKERAYPVLKEAAEFLVEYLVEAPDGSLVTGPSVSPENTYILPNGKKGSLCMGPSMDSQIANALFEACIRSCQLLGVDQPFSELLVRLRSRLHQPRAGRNGTLMEWAEDYEEAEPGHRHISHLFALYPGEQITPCHTPRLAEAAAQTLRRRLKHGGGHTGWSAAWIVHLYARLGDAANAYLYLQHLLVHATYPNMFSAHPTFQIDANFGATSAIAEMLLQSHREELQLLPALPKAWPEGRVSGLRARGGYKVDLAWSGGKLREAWLECSQDRTCLLRIGSRVAVFAENGEIEVRQDGGLARFEVRQGHKYGIRLREQD